MHALTLFQQNFAVAESLLQMYQLTGGLKEEELPEELRRAVCIFWEEQENARVHHASNDRITLLVRPTARIPGPILIPGGLDFLLRQAVVVACTALETFLWNTVLENALTIVRARRTGADEEIKNLSLTLEDYISIEHSPDRDMRVRQIILKNFERKPLYSPDAIDRVARILTVRNFWEQVEKVCGESATNLRRLIGDLIPRRNVIAHRADRPDDSKELDTHGLTPISSAWTNMRVQAVKTLVTAAAGIFSQAMAQLEKGLAAVRPPSGQPESNPMTKGLTYA